MPRPRSRQLFPVVAVLSLWLLASPAWAQQRPLATEDPDPVGDGKMLIEAGIDHAWGQRFPVSGLAGNLLRGPLVGVSSGVGPSAELQIDGVSWSRLAIQERFPAPFSASVEPQGNTTSSVEDLVVGAKVRLVREAPGARPSIGLRFATRLPNAGNEKGIGTDTMDFFQSVLVGKSVRSTRVVGNIGMGILSDPTRGDRQNDVLTYGFSILHPLRLDRGPAFAQRLRSLALVAEVNGWVSTRAGTPPVGTDTRGTATFGVRYPHGAVRFDAGFYTALAGPDDRVGLTGGLTWTFDSFLRE